MNVTEHELRTYIELFHQTLEETSKQFLPADQQSLLLHEALLPANVVGYVSTQFGVAIEYIPSPNTTIDIVRGSKRVEELLFDAPPAVRKIPAMLTIAEGPHNFSDVGTISGITFEGAQPVLLSGPNAGVRVAAIRIKALKWQREITFAEIFGNRTQNFWSRELAIARAKDEVLAALTQGARASSLQMSLSDYIAKFKERTILLLGDYDDEGKIRLQRIASAVASLGYDSILVSDVPDIAEQDLTQKVSMLGGLARFVIVDDSTKSGHLTEVQLCRTNNWITILLRNQGKGASWMTAGISATSNILLEQSYISESPMDAVLEATAWAEEKIIELGKKFDSLFPWRQNAFK